MTGRGPRGFKRTSIGSGDGAGYHTIAVSTDPTTTLTAAVSQFLPVPTVFGGGNPITLPPSGEMGIGWFVDVYSASGVNGLVSPSGSDTITNAAGIGVANVNTNTTLTRFVYLGGGEYRAIQMLAVVL